MSQAFVVRYQMRPDTADLNQALIADVFAELEQLDPDGISYAAFRLADGVTFVHVGTTAEDARPLSELPAFQAFQKGFADRVADGPHPSPAELLGCHGFRS
jgi:hypothetical protein